MKVREQREDLARRVWALLQVVLLLLVLIAVRFWAIQVLDGETYQALAENNRLRQMPIKAPRGLIEERTGQVLAENVPSYHLALDRSRSDDLEAALDYAAEVTGRSRAELAEALERRRSDSYFKPVILAEDLSLAEVARFSATSLEHPEFEIAIEQLRLYRYGHQTAHLLGHLGEVNESDLERDPDLFRPGDLVGRNGIEAAYDRQLRGRDGERVVVVDSHGKPLEEYRREKAQPGTNLRLTIDLDLQQAAARLLEDRVGAVVALDPRDGAVRTLVSAPNYDPNLFTRRLGAEEWKRLLEAPDHPLQNRALASVYSPGSVFKIVMAIAGLAEGVVSPSDTEVCRGAVTLYNHRFRCWARGGHGRVDLHRAIMRSCDVYFYHLGQKLGIERIATYARRLGLGQPTGIDLEGERAGLVPDPEWSLARRQTPWYPGETISVAIGQGPLTTTPLQLATMMATVANGGRPVRPHLVAGASPRPEAEAPLPEWTLSVVREALAAVVNDPGGTGRGSYLEEVEVAGKTGTVQVVTQATWTDNASLPPELRDHAWFVAYAPADAPELVVAVFIEHGGAGSAAAAPVAQALFDLYFGVDPSDGVRVAGRPEAAAGTGE